MLCFPSYNGFSEDTVLSSALEIAADKSDRSMLDLMVLTKIAAENQTGCHIKVNYYL